MHHGIKNTQNLNGLQPSVHSALPPKEHQLPAALVFFVSNLFRLQDRTRSGLIAAPYGAAAGRFQVKSGARQQHEDLSEVTVQFCSFALRISSLPAFHACPAFSPSV